MTTVDITINSEDDRYKLVFLLDSKNAPMCYYFELVDHPEEVWDNESFLDEMYLTMKSYVDWAPLEVTLNVRDAIEEFIERKEYEMIIEMFETAQELGLWEI